MHRGVRSARSHLEAETTEQGTRVSLGRVLIFGIGRAVVFVQTSCAYQTNEALTDLSGKHEAKIAEFEDHKGLHAAATVQHQREIEEREAVIKVR